MGMVCYIRVYITPQKMEVQPSLNYCLIQYTDYRMNNHQYSLLQYAYAWMETLRKYYNYNLLISQCMHDSVRLEATKFACSREIELVQQMTLEADVEEVEDSLNIK